MCSAGLLASSTFLLALQKRGHRVASLWHVPAIPCTSVWEILKACMFTRRRMRCTARHLFCAVDSRPQAKTCALKLIQLQNLASYHRIPCASTLYVQGRKQMGAPLYMAFDLALGASRWLLHSTGLLTLLLVVIAVVIAARVCAGSAAESVCAEGISGCGTHSRPAFIRPTPH